MLVEQKAFEWAKKIVCQEMLLAYPDFNIPFKVHMDTSDTQLGAINSQHRMPVAIYLHKLNSPKKNYTTMERDLLAAIKTMKELKNISLGQQIRVYTDHKNLAYKNFNTKIVIQWCMILEDYNPELIYIPGNTNVVDNTLSCLVKDNGSKPSSTDNELFLLAKSSMINNIKDLRNEELKLFSEKSDDVMIAECYVDNEPPIA
eukprot:1569864-Ditylum_brightwellii.AAC.1